MAFMHNHIPEKFIAFELVYIQEQIGKRNVHEFAPTNASKSGRVHHKSQSTRVSWKHRRYDGEISVWPILKLTA